MLSHNGTKNYNRARTDNDASLCRNGRFAPGRATL